MTNPPIKIEVSWHNLLQITFFVGAVAVMIYIKNLILLILFTYIISTGLNPLVAILQHKAKIPRAWAITLITVLFFSIAGGVVFLTLQNLILESQNLTKDLPGLTNKIIDQTGLKQLLNVKSNDEIIMQVENFLHSKGGNSFVSDQLVLLSSNFFSGFVTLVTLAALTFYQLSDPHKVKEFVVSFSPQKNVDIVRKVISQVEFKLGRWLIGQGIMMFTMGVLCYIGFSFIGIKYALPLAILAGLLDVIPILGSTIAFIPVLIVSFATVSAPQAIAVGIYYLLLQQVEGNFLIPKIMKQSVGMDPIVVIISILIGSQLLGPLGALLAIPVSAIIMIIFEEWRQQRAQEVIS
jgi:predicted PurR-regulated permease PerM